MAARITPLFLPIRRATLAAFLRNGSVPGEVAERAGLALVRLLLDQQLTFKQVDRALIELQEVLDQNADQATEQLRGLWANAPMTNLDDIEEALTRWHYIFAPSRGDALEEPLLRYDSDFQLDCRTEVADIEVMLLSPVDPDDEYPDEFDDEPQTPAPRMTLRGGRDQARVARSIASMMDEHFDVHAFAGTGKTFLVQSLIDVAPEMFTYLVPTTAQMHGARVAANARALGLTRTRTMFDLAIEAAHRPLADRGIGHFRIGAAKASPEVRCGLAGLSSIGSLSPEDVLRVAEIAISSWCESPSPELKEQHFKRAFPRGYRSSYAPLIAATTDVWKAMWAPRQKTQAFAYTLSHLVKWLDLVGARISPRNGMLLVDESHDLSPSSRRLLDLYAGGCVFLGDHFQRLRGDVARPTTGTKELLMNESYRTGMSGEHSIRRTIALAPERSHETFIGSRGHITRTRHWRGRAESLQDGLRVYASEWALLEDAQRLWRDGAKYRLLPASARLLKQRVEDVVTLRSQGERGWQALAGGYYQWEELASELERDGRQNVVTLFDRGYNETAFDTMLEAQSAEGEQRITLGLVGHVKNLEVSAGALNECCFTTAQTKRGYVPAHAVYLAMTRVRDELWIPGDAFDRLTDLVREPVHS